MRIFNISLTDWSLILGIASVIIVFLSWSAKRVIDYLKRILVEPLQAVIAKLGDSVDRLDKTSQSEHKLLHDAIDKMDDQLEEHEKHLVRHDEQFESVFKNFRRKGE